MNKWLPLLMLLPLAASGSAQDPNAPFQLDDREAPPPGYVGPMFNPSYSFPSTLPNEPRPWEAIDFKTNPQAYMDAVLAYVLEGQDGSRWDVGANPVRTWYHMPWMGPGGRGREFISGLTSERRSRIGELGPGQVKCRQNWAVGFYNPVGGYALGKLFAPLKAGTSMEPDLGALPFPSGTVVAKALYTQADGTDAPLLAGAPTIQANIVRDDRPDDLACPAETGASGKPSPRAPAALHLLQLDVAVRDPRATLTGWVFGTFIYDGRLPGADPWKKIRPVGLMWGNDPGLSDADAASGVKPRESVVFSDFGLGRAFGRSGRMNGPVDNSVSSCMSCHSTAEDPSSAPMTPDANAAWNSASCWFRDIPGGQPFGGRPSATTCGATTNERSLDYSLQLAVAARNLEVARQNANRGGVNLLGARVFARSLKSVDKPVVIKGVVSLPISRDETPATSSK
jgi:hypothetical protein